MQRRTPDRMQSHTLPAVRVYADEWETVRNASTAAGLSVSEYIRSKVLANPAPIMRQSADNPALQSVSSTSLLESLALSALPSRESNLPQSFPQSENKKKAGPSRVRSQALAGECEHGFKRRGELTACGECKRKAL